MSQLQHWQWLKVGRGLSVVAAARTIASRVDALRFRCPRRQYTRYDSYHHHPHHRHLPVDNLFLHLLAQERSMLQPHSR